jgi:hypothetical protein
MKRSRQPALPCLALLLLSAGLACSKRDFATCDITQSACQEDIYYKMLSLRGDAYDPFGSLPSVTVISEAQYRAILEEEAVTAAQNGPSPWDKGLVLLHFTSTASSQVDAGTGVDGGAGRDAGTSTSDIDYMAAHTYAFYSWKTKDVTIISHSDQTDDSAQAEAMISLAHELVHALQDREFDLDKSSTTSDDYYANDTIVEGDARFYEYLFTKDLCPHISGCKSVYTLTYELDYYWSHFDALGSPLNAATMLVYPLGGKYENTVYDSGGNAAVRHAYAKAPQHTVGFLIGDDGIMPPVNANDVCPLAAKALPLQGDSVGADQFGALLFYTFLRGWGVSHDVAFTTAQTWAGDFLLVQANTDFSTTAVSWRIEFSAAPPASVVQALTATGELTVKTEAQALQITVSDSTTPIEWITVRCQ